MKGSLNERCATTTGAYAAASGQLLANDHIVPRGSIGCAGHFSLLKGINHRYHYLRNIDLGVNGGYVTFVADDLLSVRFEMRSTAEWITAVDDWRRKQPEIPSRAEAIRRLVEKALAMELGNEA